MSSTSATTLLLETLRAFSDQKSLPLPWAVGYSGGRDSGVLLWALSQLVPEGELKALHVDHGWRSLEERAAETQLVAEVCSQLGVVVEFYLPPIGGTGDEASARSHRYSCFRRFSDRHPTSPIFLAHHADDQAETVLMRLLKGRSWQGLGGMAPRRGPFMRPLLALRSSLLAQVAEEQGIRFHRDSTNDDLRLARNHLRSVLPLLVDRYPRAVEALGDFARVWAEVAPRSEVHTGWIISPGGGEVPEATWDSWTFLERQAQLLAVATLVPSPRKLARRFLEVVCRDGRRAHARGSAWSWERTRGLVRWTTVVQRAANEYFIISEPGVWYDIGLHRFCWVTAAPVPFEGQGFWVPGIDEKEPLVWRSALAGMRMASMDDPEWDRTKRHRRLGSLDPGRCALVIQGGLMRAVVDLEEKRLVWSESLPEKLHKTGIFVTLVSVR